MSQLVTKKNIPMPKIGQDPPDQIVLLRWGLNPTKKGPVYLTKESAAKIIEAYEKDGHALIFDIEHKTFQKNVPVEEKRAFGYYGLSLNEELGIMASSINWTDEGRELVKSGKWGYFSVAVLIDEKDAAQKIINTAITNSPATQDAAPLLLSANNHGDNVKMITHSLITLSDDMPADQTLMSKVKPLREMQTSLGACMNAMQLATETYVDGPVKEIAQTMSASIPDWLTCIAELIEAIDPEGKTMPQDKEDVSDKDLEQLNTEKKEKKEAVDKDTTVDKKEKTQELSVDMSDLVEVCRQITGEQSKEKIKAKLLALQHNISVADDEVSAAKKSQKELLVQAGIAERKIPTAEKEKFLALSLTEIETYLDAARPRGHGFVALSQKSLDQNDLGAIGGSASSQQLKEDLASLFSSIR